MNETQQENKIFLTQEEAKSYREFKRNRSRFITLMEAGVFDLKEGKAEINFHNGKVQTINIHTRTYKRVPNSGTIPV